MFTTALGLLSRDASPPVSLIENSFEILRTPGTDGIGRSLVATDGVMICSQRINPAYRATKSKDLIHCKNMSTFRTTDVSSPSGKEQFIDSISGVTLKAFDNQGRFLTNISLVNFPVES